MNSDTKQQQQWINRLGLALIACYGLMAAIFVGNFAELNITIKVLNFPIFISEILIFILTVLVVIKLIITRQFQRYYIWWGIYSLWFIVMALVGYFQYGPLALRNAALFYYLLIAFFVYEFFERSMFSLRYVTGGLLAIIIACLWFNWATNYFWYMFVILAVSLTLKKWPEWIWLMPVLLITNWQYLFVGSRAHLLGVTGAVVFLILIVGGLFIRVPFILRMVVMMIIAGGIIVGVYSNADRNDVKSLFGIKQLLNLYNHNCVLIDQRKQNYVPQLIETKIYNPNKLDFMTVVNTGLPRTGFRHQLEQNQDKEISSNLSKESLNQGLQKLVNLNQYKTDELNKLSESGKVDKPNKIDKLDKIDKPDKVDKSDKIDKSDKADKIEKSDAQDKPKILKFDTQNINETMNGYLKYQFIDDYLAQESLVPTPDPVRNIQVAYHNILFRIFIWKDMIEELNSLHAWGGVGFGKPQRSPSLEMLDWAPLEWSRDGWIAMHNSFLDFIYRAGIIGVLMTISLWTVLGYLIRKFIVSRDFVGILLASIIIYWFTQAMFSVTFELPYFAVPIWACFGLIYAYAFKKE